MQTTVDEIEMTPSTSLTILFRGLICLSLSFLLGLLLPAASFAQGFGYYDPHPAPLVLDVSKGPPPLSVRIVGPKSFVDRVKSWDGRFYFGSSGFSINWGDGVQEPQHERGTNQNSKRDYLQHTYKVPGAYSVYASQYHLGPNDAPVSEWRNGAGVQVLGAQATGAPGAALSLKFLSPKGGEICSYQNFPTVEWSLDADRRVDVHIELLNGLRVLTHQVIKGVATRGFHHNDTLRFSTYDEVDKILRKTGSARFKVRIILVDETGKSILLRDSREFTMTSQSEAGDGLQLQERDPSKPTTVTVVYDVWHPKCFSYILDWGDGKIEKHIARPGGQALLQKTEYKFVHTYPSKSKYKIKLHSNNLEPFLKLDDIVSYEALDIDLTK